MQKRKEEYTGKKNIQEKYPIIENSKNLAEI